MTRQNNARLAEIEGKSHGAPSPAQAPSKVEPAKNELGLFSSEAVLSILKLILAGSPLPEVLAIIARLVESEANGMFCTIWLPDPDGKHLYCAAAPSLPGFSDHVGRTEICARGASCGTAVYRREPVYVTDILIAPSWDDYRDRMTPFGIRAVWSTPLFTRGGKTLGTFAILYRESRAPGEAELQLIENASQITGIAIEREQSQSDLKEAFARIEKSEAHLREVVDAIRHESVILGADGSAVYVNRTVREYIGLSESEVMEGDFRSRVFHPDDIERLREFRRTGFAGTVAWENEVRVRRHDGQYRWYLIRYSPLFDGQGGVKQWYAAGMDIEDRKREEERLRRENLMLREDIDLSSMYEEIVGDSPTLKAALNLVSVVAPTDSSVLILGETGTGKELVARAIHNLSGRRERAFVKLNCAAIPLGLLESELFGHEKGAFTGAIAQKTGRFELANKGTLFLDEVGDIPLELQAKLLRILQEQEFERLGSTKTHKVDVRLVAATHRDLAAMVKQGTFREDLYYRLKVFPIEVPTLRQRPEDIPKLVRHFTAVHARRMNKKIDEIPAATMDALARYRWPGNVRELQNFIERAVILSPDSILRAPISELDPFNPHKESNLPISGLAQVERDHILRALEASNWVVGGRHGAAERLGMKRTSLVYRMRKLRINRPPASPPTGFVQHPAGRV
jgi:formate hydrogenlyase transcriptional activator